MILHFKIVPPSADLCSWAQVGYHVGHRREYLLDKFCSGMSNSAVDGEFKSMNELRLYVKQSTFKQKHT